MALVLVSLGFAAPAAAADATQLVQQVEAKYKDVSAIQAEFVQISRSEVFGDEKQSGQVVLKRPKKMRWIFRDGVHKEFVTDGKTMWIYTKEDNQVIKYNDIGSNTGQADQLLQSLDKLDEVFKVDLLESASGSHALDLQPKTPGQVKKLQLELDKNLVVSKVVITDQFDNVTELRFTEVKLNVDVPDSQFTFQVPAGASVISADGAAIGAAGGH